MLMAFFRGGFRMESLERLLLGHRCIQKQDMQCQRAGDTSKVRNPLSGCGVRLPIFATTASKQAAASKQRTEWVGFYPLPKCPLRRANPWVQDLCKHPNLLMKVFNPYNSKVQVSEPEFFLVSRPLIMIAQATLSTFQVAFIFFIPFGYLALGGGGASQRNGTHLVHAFFHHVQLKGQVSKHYFFHNDSDDNDMATDNSYPSYVKHVSSSIYAFFTVFWCFVLGRGKGLPMDLYTNCLCVMLMHELCHIIGIAH